MPHTPKTPQQWQIAVDAAKGALALHDARLYGLVTGGPTVNVERCLALLEAGKEKGIRPRADAVERFIEAWQREAK